MQRVCSRPVWRDTWPDQCIVLGSVCSGSLRRGRWHGGARVLRQLQWGLRMPSRIHQRHRCLVCCWDLLGVGRWQLHAVCSRPVRRGAWPDQRILLGTVCCGPLRRQCWLDDIQLLRALHGWLRVSSGIHQCHGCRVPCWVVQPIRCWVLRCRQQLSCGRSLFQLQRVLLGLPRVHLVCMAGH